MIVLLLALLWGVIGCRDQESPAPVPAAPAPAPTQAEDQAENGVDCQVLSAEEVTTISGTKVTFEAQGAVPELEACRGYYKKLEKSLAGSLGIAFLILDPGQAIESCISPEQSDNPNIAPAEKGKPVLGGRGCLYGNGNHVKLAVKNYVVHIWNHTEYDPLCTEEQLLQLAEIVADRMALE
jgi:hypothetical protein